jgi:hypothetical protein
MPAQNPRSLTKDARLGNDVPGAEEMAFPFEIGVAFASLKTIKMVGGE